MQAAIAATQPQICRKDMPSPPSYQKVNPADQPVLYLALSFAHAAALEVDEYAETLPRRSASRW